MESAESAFCKYYFENKQKQRRVLVLVSLMQGGSFFFAPCDCLNGVEGRCISIEFATNEKDLKSLSLGLGR